nr:unnamed protein product [Digitaria exilis]
MDIPYFSSMLSSSATTPSGSLHAKAWSRFASVSCTILSPSAYPGHIRRPAPNGNSSKSWPLTSTSLPTNRSGRNSSAASPHTAGSRPMAQTLTSTRWPPTDVSSRDSRGASSGPAGCRRMVSFTMASRYGSLGMSCSVTKRSRPTTLSSSSVALAIASGFLRSSESAHSTVTAEVSVPAAIKSCTRAYSECLDAVPFDGYLKAGVVGELQQQVHHVSRDKALALAPPPLTVLVHHVVQQLIQHLAQLLHPLYVHPLHPRDEVADADQAADEEQLVDHPPELIRRHRRASPFHDVLPSQRDARDDAEAHHGEVVLEHHHPTGGGGRHGAQAAHGGVHLLVADVLRRPELARAEELGLTQLARLAPVRAVGGPQYVGAAVEDVPAGRQPRPVEEGDVVGLEEEPGHGHRRADDGGVGAELERHERAVARGELVQGAVRERADEVEVADHRPWPRARWEVVLLPSRAPPPAKEEHGEEEEEDADERTP